MKTVLVTGATGFVGWHVAKKLVERGLEVRALSRSAQITGLDVQTVRGDLRDFPSLQLAVRGCDTVFHVAADYRLWSANPAEMYASNVEGTRNLIRASVEAGAHRIVYCSTVGAIGMRANLIADEDSPVSLADMKGHYKRSKFLAEQAALDAAKNGAPVVVVNPTTPLGDHDAKPTPTGKVIVDFLQGKIPAYIDTGLNYVDVHDVAEGHILAAERGRLGERYILGSENLTLIAMLERLAIPAGRPAPKLRLPYFVAYGAALASTAWAGLTKQHPGIPLDGVRYAHLKMWVSHDKAARELGYRPGRIDDALSRAVRWFRENGHA